MLSEKPRNSMSETRKITKSTMEKKRRARINDSLTELKMILGGMILNKTERFDKMEKADILEMTVKYVKQLQKQKETGTASCAKQSADAHYSNGVHSCVNEVLKFITAKDDAFSADIKTTLLDHLACMLTGEAKITNTDNAADADKLTRDRHCFDDIVQETPEMCKNDQNNNDHKAFFSNTNENFINTVLINYSTCNSSPTGTAQSQLPSPNNPVMISPKLTTYTPLQPGTNQTSMPSVPLTILVPASVYPSLGTACVIPFNIQTSNPQIGNIIYTNNHSPMTYQHLKADSQIFIPFTTTASDIQRSGATPATQANLYANSLNAYSNSTVFTATSVPDQSNQTCLTSSVVTATSTRIRSLPTETHALLNPSACTPPRALSSSNGRNTDVNNDEKYLQQRHNAVQIRQSSGSVWRPW